MWWLLLSLSVPRRGVSVTEPHHYPQLHYHTEPSTTHAQGTTMAWRAAFCGPGDADSTGWLRKWAQRVTLLRLAPPSREIFQKLSITASASFPRIAPLGRSHFRMTCMAARKPRKLGTTELTHGGSTNQVRPRLSRSPPWSSSCRGTRVAAQGMMDYPGLPTTTLHRCQTIARINGMFFADARSS